MIGEKVKVVTGYNSDLIGKIATVIGSSGSDIEIVIDGRGNQRYTIPALNVTMLNPSKPLVVKVPEAVKLTPEERKNNLITTYSQTKKETLNWLNETIAGFKEQIKELEELKESMLLDTLK